MFKIFSIICTIGILLLGFQNCSARSFGLKNVPSSQTPASSTPNSTDGSITQTQTQIDNEINTTPTTDVDFKSCQSYQELSGSEIIVPARTSEQVCYYIRLMDQKSNGESGTRGEILATDVTARPHDPRPIDSVHPYVLGMKEISSLRLLGSRNVALSSDFKDAQASMFIDNFFLLEQTTSVGTFRAWAYGTADAEPTGGGKISLEQVGSSYFVDDFYTFARGGTAIVTAINMTTAVPAGLEMNIRFRGLDCGGSAAASDVFMVFY